MTTPLERAVASLTDPSVPIADALRGLLVVSRRIAADDVSRWLKSELEGYEGGQEVPTYRRGDHLPVALRFDGYGGSSVTRRLSRHDLPDELGGVLDNIKLAQPVAELAALCEGDGDPRIPLPMAWLAHYRYLAAQGKAPHMEMMQPNDAVVLIPDTHLRGILDRVKSAALDLALNLEDVSLDAGVSGGPTVRSEPGLQTAVTIHMQHIYATNSSVVIGDNASVTQIQVGDVSGLLDAARSLLSEEGVAALAEALKQDGGQPATETRSLLDRVRGGAYVLAGGMAGNAAYDGLVELLGMAFPDLPF